jgi:ATP-dependent Clp protease ATP-binding subunit ClpC
MTRPPDIKDIDKEIESIKAQKEGAIKAQDFEKAASLRDDEKKAKEKKDAVLKDWEKKREEKEIVVSEEDMRVVVAKWTGVPLHRMEQEDNEKLLRMEVELKGKVIGQSEAVVAVAKALRRSRADLKDPRRPIGSFIFLGPTGVGKTYLAQTLAEYMFGARDALIQFDMSEYREEHTISRLVGSPPGYIGHDEGGQLSEQVRRRPYSVVLFDEIEKAHPNVLHLLLQVLEEGKLTDSLGRKIDFRNTIIILTTNIGAEQMKKVTLGFGGDKEDGNYDSMKGKVLGEAKRVLKPEFINRFDDLIVFHQLNREDLKLIVDLEVAKLVERIKQKEIKVVLDDKAREFLIEKGFDPAYGARPMRRAVERYLEDPMAEEMLKGTFKPGDTADVTATDKELIFKSVGTAKASEPAPTA